ncbi:hypothetical protein BDW72DRAFT_170332 [Aspergillus terricola var. indicus]
MPISVGSPLGEKRVKFEKELHSFTASSPPPLTSRLAFSPPLPSNPQLFILAIGSFQALLAQIITGGSSFLALSTPPSLPYPTCIPA